MLTQKLHRIISRRFLRASLIPVLTIEILLLVMYFGVNWYISVQNRNTLLDEVRQVITPLTKQNAQAVNLQLQSIHAATQLAQGETEYWFQHKTSYPKPSTPPVFNIGKNNAFYKANKNGCGLFYPGATKITEETRQKATLSEALDPLYGRILASSPNLVAIYLNTFDNMNRLCPYIDGLWETYPPTLTMADYNFYYLADAKHNPQRKVVWTSVYLDPAGQGWMASAIAPVYRKNQGGDSNFLEGVIGLDITVDKMTKNILQQALPWEASSFLVDSSGMILAMPEPVEGALGLKELKAHVYKSSITTTVAKPEEFNLFKNPDTSLARTFKNFVTQKQELQELTINGETYIIAQATIEETGWRLMVLVNNNKVLEPVNQLEALSKNLGYIVITLMLLFYLAFFSVLFRQARTFSHTIAAPVEQLASAAMQIGTSRAFPDIKTTNIEELDKLTHEFLRTHQELKARTAALIQEQVARQIQEKETEMAYKVGLFESTSAYLHNIGNALAGSDGYLRSIDRVLQSTEQWQEAFAMIRKTLESDKEQGLQLLGKLEQIQLQNAVPQVRESVGKLKSTQQNMLDSIRYQQTLFNDSHRDEIRQFTQVVDLDEVLAEICNEVRDKWMPPEITLDCPTTGYHLSTQKFQLKFGLVNIIKNAVEAINEVGGKGLISIQCTTHDSTLQIRITDNGCGITPEHLSELFVAGKSTKFDGHGLGLHSFAMFLKSRGGMITAKSDGKGMGSTFTIELPYES